MLCDDLMVIVTLEWKMISHSHFSHTCIFTMMCVSVCRQEAVCGDVGETAVRCRCQKNVRAVREYRGVYSTQRTWRSQQRCPKLFSNACCASFIKSLKIYTYINIYIYTCVYIIFIQIYLCMLHNVYSFFISSKRMNN